MNRSPALESYDDVGPYVFATTGEAERYGRLAMVPYCIQG